MNNASQQLRTAADQLLNIQARLDEAVRASDLARIHAIAVSLSDDAAALRSAAIAIEAEASPVVEAPAV